MLPFFGIFKIKPLFHSGMITSSFHIASNSFSSYLTDASMPAFMVLAVITSILPLYPFFSFVTALINFIFLYWPDY
jgi:hypothetical protein